MKRLKKQLLFAFAGLVLNFEYADGEVKYAESKVSGPRHSPRAICVQDFSKHRIELKIHSIPPALQSLKVTFEKSYSDIRSQIMKAFIENTSDQPMYLLEPAARKEKYFLNINEKFWGVSKLVKGIPICPLDPTWTGFVTLDNLNKLSWQCDFRTVEHRHSSSVPPRETYPTEVEDRLVSDTSKSSSGAAVKTVKIVSQGAIHDLKLEEVPVPNENYLSQFCDERTGLLSAFYSESNLRFSSCDTPDRACTQVDTVRSDLKELVRWATPMKYTIGTYDIELRWPLPNEKLKRNRVRSKAGEVLEKHAERTKEVEEDRSLPETAPNLQHLQNTISNLQNYFRQRPEHFPNTTFVSGHLINGIMSKSFDKFEFKVSKAK